MTRISIPLSDESKDALRRNIEERDKTAGLLGVLVFDHNNAVSALTQRINKSCDFEKRFMEGLIKEHGHDPDDGQWRVVDGHVVKES